jgi:hypothetical protein
MKNAFQHTPTGALVQFAGNPLRESRESHRLQQASGFDSDGEYYCYNRHGSKQGEYYLIYTQTPLDQRDALDVFIQSRNGNKNPFTWYDENSVAHTVKFTTGHMLSRETTPGKWRVEVSVTENV